MTTKYAVQVNWSEEEPQYDFYETLAEAQKMAQTLVELFAKEGSDIIEHLISITVIEDGEVIETHNPQVRKN